MKKLLSIVGSACKIAICVFVVLYVSSEWLFGHSMFDGMKNPLYEKYLVGKSAKGDERSMMKLCEYYLDTGGNSEKLFHYAKILANSGNEYGVQLVAILNGAQRFPAIDEEVEGVGVSPELGSARDM
jgi:hypothetical protein